VRILYIYSSYTSGGGERATLDLAENVQKRGGYVVTGFPKKSFLYESAKQRGLPVEHLKLYGSLDFRAVYWLMKIIRKHKVDILHVQQGKAFWPAVFVKIMLGNKLKLIFHRRTMLPVNKDFRGVYSPADRVIVISNAVKDVVVGTDKVNPAKVVVIYDGIKVQKFVDNINRDTRRKELGYGHTDFVVTTVSALNPPRGKGQDVLLRVTAKLRRKYPVLRILIVGDGAYRAKLESYATKLGVADITKFTGRREDIADIFAASDLSCMLSWDTEALGLAAIEAQAAGRPVIVTNTGGLVETVLPGKTGWVIDKDDDAGLERLLSNILDDRGKVAGMEHDCKTWVTEKFDAEDSITRVCEVYKQLLASIK